METRASALSTLVLLAMLAACAAAPRDKPVADLPGVAVEAPAPRTYRPGVGIIESASVVSLSSSAGGTAGAVSSATMAYRLKMADGATQDVVQAGERFQVGDRVQMTSDGRLIRP